MTRLFSALLLLILVSACSLPRIIILNDPLNATQHNDLGVSYEQRQEFDLALREYRRAAKLAPDWALPRFNQGNVHARLEQWSAAIDSYRAALKLEPESTQVLNNLAWALVQNGEFDDGITMAERALATDRNNPICWDTLATAYLAADHLDLAQSAARAGLALDPSPELQLELEKKLRRSAGNDSSRRAAESH